MSFKARLVLICFALLGTSSVVNCHPTHSNNVIDHEDEMPEPEPVIEPEPESEPTPEENHKFKVVSGNFRSREKLRYDLFKNYDRKTNPDNLTVALGLSLINFDIDEQKSTVEAGSWLKFDWYDSRLAWDPEDYGGVSVLRLDPDDFWKPDIQLYNTADQLKMLDCHKVHVLLFNSGRVLWVRPCHTSSTCKLTLSEFPYGEQNCNLKFGSWTYDGNTVGLKFYEDKEEVNLADYWESPKWEIVSSSAKQSERFYKCCKEPYSDIMFYITAKRRSVLQFFDKKLA